MSVEAPSTFLELCKRTARECGASGSGPADVPSTVVSQTGELGRIVGWVVEAWLTIQNKHQDWHFLRTSTSWTTVAGTAQYTLGSGSGTVGVTAANFGRWKRNTFRNYPTASGTNGEIEMGSLDYDTWRNTYLLGGTRDARSQPSEFAIGPDKSIWLGPVPAAGYTITADYFRSPVTLEANGDTPNIPAAYMLAIVYQAMQFYALYESATEVLVRAERGLKPILAQMEKDRVQELMWAGALC